MAIETLRPNAVGSETAIPKEVPTGETHWTLVDEETPDDATTRVQTDTDSVTYRDLYNIPNHSEGSGTINKITVYFRCQRGASTTGWAKASIRTHDTTYDGTQTTVTNTWTTYSQEWITNPYTGNAWIWDEIDALEIGVQLTKIGSGSGAGYYVNCTQVYVEVDYTPTATEKSSSDTGAGSEGTPVSTATLAGSESGQGQEAISSQLAIITAAEVGTSVELGALLKDLFATELGRGSDSFIAKIEAPTRGGGMELWI